MNKLFKTTEKIILAFIGGLIGLIVGALIRLFALPTSFNSDILWQYLPWMLSASFVFAILSYIFPRVSAFILAFVLGIEIGSSS